MLTLAEHTRKGEQEGGNSEDAESLLLSKIPITVKLGRGLVGAASASGQQRLIEDPTSCPEFDAVVDNPLQLSELRSMALTPCSTSQGQGDDKVSGGTSVLVLYNKLRQNASSSGATSPTERIDVFNEADGRMLTVYGRLVSAVRSYFEKMREQQSQLKASRSVIDVAMTLTANLQGQNLHYNITLLARQLVPCEWSTLYLLDEQSNRL